MSFSLEYQEQLKQLHKKSKAFGTRETIPAEIINCIEKYNVKSILDFGCGKGLVVDALKEKYPKLEVYGYDPANIDFTFFPENVDMIFSTDVLEHIEPELLEETLIELGNKTNKVMYHLIACHPAKKYLADGRNAHLIIEQPEWWGGKLNLLAQWTLLNPLVSKSQSTLKNGTVLDIIKYKVTLEKDISSVR
jgi:hypothetical protein